MNGHAFSDHAAGILIRRSIGLPSGKEHTVYAKRTEKIPGGKIQAKQELIDALNIRIESEQRELEEMFEQKRRKELEAVSDIIEDAGLAPEEVTEVLQQYIESRRANAS